MEWNGMIEWMDVNVSGILLLNYCADGETINARKQGSVEITASTSTAKRSKKRARKGNQPTAEKVAAVFNLSPLKVQSPANTSVTAAPAATIPATTAPAVDASAAAAQTVVEPASGCSHRTSGN